MNFEQAKKYLFTLYSFEKERKISQRQKGFNLDHYRDFLAKIGNPQDKLKCVHVAGSKGKGSTCAFIAAGIESQGKKAGLFTSPAIRDLREQISVNGEWISRDDFAALVLFVKNKLEEFNLEISYFEFINTIAFLYFVEQKVDFAVLEVGLGGLYDSTNVIKPVLTVLTQIELEHKDVLGDTIEEILANKLGIMKSEVPMFVAGQEYDLKQQIENRAGELNVPLFYVDNSYELQSIDVNGTSFDNHKISLIGQAYIYSVKAALELCKYLFAQSQNVFDEKKFWSFARELTLPGRFEIFQREGRIVVFDMAHTLKGAAFLRESLERVFPDKHFVFLVSMMKDKNVEDFARILFKKGDEVIASEASISRAIGADELKERTAADMVEADPVKAFEIALNKKEILVCTGSHFLLHDLYPLVNF